MNRTAKITATALVASVVLVGCKGGESGGKASGLRDDVKFKAHVAGKPAKTHTKVEPKTRRSCSGTGTRRTCTTVPDGTKTVVVTDQPATPAKPALYCVELDNVNGKPNRDDEWFEVSASTYHKLSNLNEGAKVTEMAYLATGCNR